ncbi:hypothetical protein NDU88_005886 [Pleurodeles waltl]|uniref:Uncharacterized protein n=1 Tax=Pleurodeles waltl TaxID=8319 RepID=A0AAV7LME2_PLEWA|nr:hypothetical protein NDU88_005886 [Pleurodeles waltl]
MIGYETLCEVAARSHVVFIFFLLLPNGDSGGAWGKRRIKDRWWTASSGAKDTWSPATALSEFFWTRGPALGTFNSGGSELQEIQDGGRYLECLIDASYKHLGAPRRLDSEAVSPGAAGGEGPARENCAGVAEHLGPRRDRVRRESSGWESSQPTPTAVEARETRAGRSGRTAADSGVWRLDRKRCIWETQNSGRRPENILIAAWRRTRDLPLFCYEERNTGITEGRGLNLGSTMEPWAC